MTVGSIIPFKIAITDAKIQELRECIRRTIWPPTINNDHKWKAGTDHSYLSKICDHWQSNFDWRHWEAKLNAHPNFIVEIDSTKIHFLHLRSNKPGDGDRIKVPTGIASFPKELAVSPREWAERIYNVRHWTDMPSGGHFAAIEEPRLLADDIKTFFARNKD